MGNGVNVVACLATTQVVGCKVILVSKRGYSIILKHNLMVSFFFANNYGHDWLTIEKVDLGV
jgi:hypothetical protein